MKKLLVVTGLVLSSILSYGQEKELIIKRATNWFEKEYVPNKLYDPYSYKPMKAWVENYTISDYYNDKNNELGEEIKIYKTIHEQYARSFLLQEKYSKLHKSWNGYTTLKSKSFDEERTNYLMGKVKEYENGIDSLNKISYELTDKFNSMTIEEQNKLHHYIVRIDAYVRDESGRESLKKYSIDYYNLPNNKYKISKDK